jgi:hypothetical protein
MRLVGGESGIVRPHQYNANFRAYISLEKFIYLFISERLNTRPSPAATVECALQGISHRPRPSPAGQFECESFSFR